jgi:tetratricopeptide (TPR) repeat protein
VQVLRAASNDEALQPLLGDGGRDAAQLVAALRGESTEPREQPIDAGSARFRLFEDITVFLSKLARQQPLFLVFDDLHWADDATLLLLRFVAREVRALPLLVLGTSRETDARDGSTGALLAALSSGTHVRRLYLQGLSQDDTRNLVRATLQRELDEAKLRELYAVTEGNPFFVHEVVRLIGDDVRAGNAALGGSKLALPSRVREVIAMRLQGLPPEAQRMLSLAAVIGREFRLAVLEQITGESRAEVLRVLALVARARIVRDVGDADDGGRTVADTAAGTGQYRFVHALIRESLYGALEEPERARLHEQVGRALEALFGVDASAHLPELAHHFFRAASGGEVDRAIAYCVRAAQQAFDLLAFEPAVFHYRRALEALELRLPIDEERRFALKLALGSAQFRAGEDGNPALLAAAQIARRLGRPDLLGQVVLTMCGWPLFGRRGKTANPELYPLLTEAVASPLEHAPVLRVQLLAASAINCPPETPLTLQVARSREALELARTLPNDEALYDALLARLRLMQAPEHTAQRLGLSSELLAVASRLGQKERVFTAHETRVQLMIALGDVPGADQEIARCKELSQELRFPRCTLQVIRFALERALGDGRLREIRTLTEQLVQLRGKAELSPGYLVTMFIWQSFALAFRGHRKWYQRTIGPLAADVERSTPLRAHCAFLYAAFGELEQARACYQPLLNPSFLDEIKDDDWMLSMAQVADAVAACGDRAAAAELYPRLLPHAAMNVAHFDMLVYLGCSAHWLGMLASLLGKRDAAIAHFETALEMNASLGARVGLARTSYAYGRMLLRRDGGEPGTITPAEASHARALLRDAVTQASEMRMSLLVQDARALID